jgi:transcriptional regulator with XRE-family HTH domain
MSIPNVLIKHKQYYGDMPAKNSDRVAGMEQYLKYLGKRVQQLREDFHWSQPDLVREMGRFGVNMSQGAIGHIETGRNKPSPAALIALAFALRVSTDYLLGISDDPTQPETRIVSDAQRDLERLFSQLSPAKQHELLVIARALVEDEESPPVITLDGIIMAALEFAEAYDSEAAERLYNLLDSATPGLAPYLTFRRKQLPEEQGDDA